MGDQSDLWLGAGIGRAHLYQHGHPGAQRRHGDVRYANGNRAASFADYDLFARAAHCHRDGSTANGYGHSGASNAYGLANSHPAYRDD